MKYFIICDLKLLQSHWKWLCCVFFTLWSISQVSTKEVCDSQGSAVWEWPTAGVHFREFWALSEQPAVLTLAPDWSAGRDGRGEIPPPWAEGQDPPTRYPLLGLQVYRHTIRYKIRYWSPDWHMPLIWSGIFIISCWCYVTPITAFSLMWKSIVIKGQRFSSEMCKDIMNKLWLLRQHF